MRNRLLITIMVLLIIGGIATAIDIYTSRKKVVIMDGKVLYLVEGYKYVEPGKATCQAIVPECGYCPGEIVDKNCYAEKQN